MNQWSCAMTKVMDLFQDRVGSREPAIIFRSGALDQSLVHSFAEIVRDFNPIHCEPDFARARGFPSTVVHGMLTMAFAEYALGRCFRRGWMIQQLEGRFTNMLYVGQTVTIWVEPVREINVQGISSVRVKFGAESDGGQRVLVGKAELAPLPVWSGARDGSKGYTSRTE
jgi:acyl dehydratase